MEFIKGYDDSLKEQSAVQESMKVKTFVQTEEKKNEKRDNIWYANCICLADVLDSDHDLSRRPGDENPLETYWNKYASLGGNDELKNAYTQIFSDGTKTRTQPKIHKMFVELINKFGPKFQDIDGPNEVPRIALSVRNISCEKKIAGQRTKINTDSELTELVVETHRGGSYDQKNPNPAKLFKYVPSTIFDNGSNVDFLLFDPPVLTFSNNYFPESNTRMTTKKMLENASREETDVSSAEKAFFRQVMQSETGKSWTDNQKLLIHTFRGKDGAPTYSVQWGQVTADEVTFELFGQNRRSWCSTIKKVKNMIISISETSSIEDDILARKCHILYGKTCGDGVSIDAAEQMKCGVLSNDICCCYRAAIVNGFGYRACPTTDKLFSTTRNLEVFQTKSKGKFDIDTAGKSVAALLQSLKDIEAAKNSRTDYIKTFSVKASDGKNILYVSELYDKKKEFLIGLVNSKQIPDDLKDFIMPGNTDVPTEDVLKRYCYYDMNQCIGSNDFYKIELDQFIVDIKSNIDQLKKIRIASRFTDKNDTFGESLTIIANIEVILSSFIIKKDERTEELVPDKEEILKYSNLFFKSNLEKYNGTRFLTKFKEALETTAKSFEETAKKGAQAVDETADRAAQALIETAKKGAQQTRDLLKYITNYTIKNGGDQNGGEGLGGNDDIILLMSILVPMPYSYDEVDETDSTPWEEIEVWVEKVEQKVEQKDKQNATNTNTDIIKMFDVLEENDLNMPPPVTVPVPFPNSFQSSKENFNLQQENKPIPSATDVFNRKRKKEQTFSSSSSSSSSSSKKQKRNSTRKTPSRNSLQEILAPQKQPQGNKRKHSTSAPPKLSSSSSSSSSGRTRTKARKSRDYAMKKKSRKSIHVMNVEQSVANKRLKRLTRDTQVSENGIDLKEIPSRNLFRKSRKSTHFMNVEQSVANKRLKRLWESQVSKNEMDLEEIPSRNYSRKSRKPRKLSEDQRPMDSLTTDDEGFFNR